MEFLQGGREILVIGAVDRVEPAENQGLQFLEPGERFRAGPERRGQGVPDQDLRGVLDVGNDIPDLARPQLPAG